MLSSFVTMFKYPLCFNGFKVSSVHEWKYTSVAEMEIHFFSHRPLWQVDLKIDQTYTQYIFLHMR